jgi:class 3 adenylate cyclase
VTGPMAGDVSGASGSPLPTGTVTFLRTDVEGSMKLTHALGSRWDAVNAEHVGLIRAAIEREGGVTVRPPRTDA